MISVLICLPTESDSWEIDTWLMSCRVLGRQVEQMVLRELIVHARARGVARLIGRYVPTERNGMVRDHYEKLGFRSLGANETGVTTWELDASVDVPAAPMQVDRSGFDLSIA
jgi:predicted enzyme involved in methoxymalonyl-ACP biosynthesis